MLVSAYYECISAAGKAVAQHTSVTCMMLSQLDRVEAEKTIPSRTETQHTKAQLQHSACSHTSCERLVSLETLGTYPWVIAISKVLVWYKQRQ